MSERTLVDLWDGPLLCGPNPTSHYGQCSDQCKVICCEHGLSSYLIMHFEKCKLFHVIVILFVKLEGRRQMYVVLLSFIRFWGLDCWFYIPVFVKKG